MNGDVSYVYMYGDVSYVYMYGNVSYVYMYGNVSYVYMYGDVSYVYMYGDVSYVYMYDDVSYVYMYGDVSYVYMHGDVSYVYMYGDVSYVYMYGYVIKKSVMDPIPHTQHRPICVSVQAVVVHQPTPFRRRFNSRKADWNGYSTELDNSIEDVEPIPSNYRMYVWLPEDIYQEDVELITFRG